MKRNRFVIALATFALVVVTAVPAMAESQQGFRDCGTWAVWINSETTGTTKHYAPTGTVLEAFYNGAFLQDNQTRTPYADTTWKVYTTGYIASAFAWCYY